MPHDPDYSSYISLCLSEILYDIGLNEEMVLKERRAWLLRESLTTLTHRLKGYQRTIYMFGSMTEGSTTLALKSDNDNLICDYSWNVVTDLKDCKPGEVNYVMSYDVSTPPGYCLLRLVLGHDPFQERIFRTHVTSQTFSWNSNDDGEYELHGPAIHVKGQFGYNEQDYVIALHCKTWPRSAQAWLAGEGIGRWPTKEMKSFAKQNGCFLVGVGSKDSELEQFEWRVSMSQAERCLMFSLNITQIRCYVLMKMLLKTFIHPDGNSVISSYMCKTVLFHCITHSYLGFWQESKLLYCLTLCLSALQYCVLIGNCPHFIIHENNLMEGRITTKFRTMFIEQMRRIILDTELSLRNVVYDNLGLRLQCKMKMYSRKTKLLAPTEKLRAFASGILLRNTGKYIQIFYKMVICVVRYEDLVVALQYIRQCNCKLVKFHRVD
ncbi:nucleotidyltransferase MB21D2-like [Mercenaria mercenaria]|uniref:nucleotidyltransferase MB21D2-like n=1 Tax=Mercenaria mercenaria TaxID=6596 RepID=UPI00234FB13B|nr:nucleotidyltransferase MB21D2-like [Mercenaria mercenaria]